LPELAATVAAMAITAATLRVLLRPLRATMTELCGGQDRGDLWTAISAASLLLGAWFNGTMAYYSTGRFGVVVGPHEVPAMALTHGVMVGLLVGVGAISVGVLVWTRRVRKGVAPAPRDPGLPPTQN
jgi:hypothetical protein